MRIIYISPHLDDAVLSAGGVIRARSKSGVPVELWTLMAGIPEDAESPEFAQVMHRIWVFRTARETVEARRAEDRRAAGQVGARTMHFNFLDCIYRRGPDGHALYSDVTIAPQPEDALLPDRIADVLSQRLLPDDQVVCQLAIGGHVDHVIVREAVEMLHRPLVYDADLPYLLDHPDELEPNVVGMHPSFQPVSQDEFDSWLAAIACYASQVDSVFGSHDIMRTRMQAHWAEHNGITFWTVGAPPSPA